MPKKISMAVLAAVAALGSALLVGPGQATAMKSGSHHSGTRGHGPGNSGSRSTTTEPSGSVPTADGNTGSSAHGHKNGKKNGTALTGSTSCSIRGKVSFSPHLVRGGTSAAVVTVSGLLSKCSTTPPSTKSGHKNRAAFNNGHLSGLTGKLGQNDCALLTSGTAPALSQGTVVWTPPSKVQKSTAISLPAGTGSVVTTGAKSTIHVTYTGGSVGAGSLMSSGTVSLTITSIQDEAQISGRCTTGLANVAFEGTITL